MATKVLLKDKNENVILPITRGELVLDSSGKVALHSEEFLATEEKPGLMSSSDKAKLDSVAGGAIDDKLDINSSNPVLNKVLTQIINSIKEKYLKSVSVINNKLTITDQDDNDVDFFGSIYSIVTDTTDGLVPKFDSVDGTIDDQSEDWILTNHKGNLGWYKLPLSTFTQNTTSLYIGDDVSESNTSTTNGSTYLKFFENSELKHKYKIQGSGSTVITSDSNGNLNIYNPTTFASNQIDKLTDYVKGTSVESLKTTDTLNQALGKLEYKADVTYNLVRGAYDGDGTIENLEEILKVLEGIKDTETIQSIIGKYLPLSGGTMLGSITINHDYNLGDAKIIYKNNRLNDNQTGGWADDIIIHTNASETTTAHIGVLGNKKDLSYLFLGHYSFDATNNLRIYNDHASFGNNMIYNNYISVPLILIISDIYPHIYGNNGILTLGGKNSLTEGSVVCDSKNNAFRRNSDSTNITLGTNTYRWGNFFGTTGNFTGKITFPLNTGIYYNDLYGLLGVASKGLWTGHPGNDNYYTFVGTPSYDTILRAKATLLVYRDSALRTIVDSGNISQFALPYIELTGTPNANDLLQNGIYNSKASLTNAPVTNWGALLVVNNNHYAMQTYWPDNGTDMYIRRVGVQDSTKTTEWKKIAYANETISSGYVLFSPNSSLTSTDVLNKTGGWSMKKGTWYYAGNGYIPAGSFGNIDLAGCSVITLGESESNGYTLLYITGPTATESNAKTNEIFFYNNHGASYKPDWTRVMTHRNYNEVLSVKLVNGLSFGNMISAGYLRSDYVSAGYPPEDYLKALCLLLINSYKGCVCIGSVRPSTGGSYICYVYDTTINTSTGLPEYMVGTAFLFNGLQISFGTVSGAWYYRQTLNSTNYSNYTLPRLESMQFAKTSTYVNATLVDPEVRKLALDSGYIEFWDSAVSPNTTGWFNSHWGKIRTKFGYESESKISLLGTTADTSWISFSRTGEGANYITWPGESSALCLLAFGYGNQYAQSYYYMSNKALYPATNNAKSLGTSAMKWSEVHASTVYGKLIHNTVGTWIYSAKNPAVMVSGITAGSAGSAFTIPVKDGYLSVLSLLNSNTVYFNYFSTTKYDANTNDLVPAMRIDASSGNFSAKGSIGTDAQGGGAGVSLYGGAGNTSTYGIAFNTTSSWGKHGLVTGDWATYFTMSNNDGRGWIFRRSGVGPVASIDTNGNVTATTFNGDLNGTSSSTLRFKTILVGSSTKGKDLNTELSGGGIARNYYGYLTDFTNAPSGALFGSVLEINTHNGINQSLSLQLAWDVNHANTTDTTRYLWWRTADEINKFTYSKWHRVADFDKTLVVNKGIYLTDSSGGVDVMTPDRIFAQTGEYSLTKTLFYYAGNGYTTATKPDGTHMAYLDLAGASILTFGASDAYTLLFITAPTQAGHNGITNEMLFYLNHGSGYSPGWTRVLTNRNYESIVVGYAGVGNSDFTDGTQLLSSYASDSGFSSSSYVNKIYKRNASSMFNYIKTKAAVDENAFTSYTSKYLKVYTKSDSLSYPLLFAGGLGSSIGTDRGIYTASLNTLYYNPNTLTLTTKNFAGTADASKYLKSNSTSNFSALTYYTASGISETLTLGSGWCKPSGVDSDGNSMIIRIKWSSGNYGHDIYAGPNSEELWHRNTKNTSCVWRKIIDTGNIGSQSIGYATNAEYLKIGIKSDNVNYPLVFAEGMGSSDGTYRSICTDSVSSVYYNPSSNILTSSRFASTVATGTAPMTVSSTTVVTNLNADMVDGKHASDFAIPVGTIVMWAGSTAPANWLICDGSDVNRTTYSALFTVIGTTYGSGNGSTTFNLPNLKRKFPLGALTGSFAAGRNNYFSNLGSTGGTTGHTLTVPEIPSHNHTATTTLSLILGSYRSNASVPKSYNNTTGADGTELTATTTIANTGGNSSHNNMPPYLAVNFIIKYQ